MRFFIQLSYQGTNYHGWQVQKNATSVQSEINQALSVIFNQDLLVTGAGRTDAGVHAKQMFAHFDLDFDINIQDTIYSLNRLLPDDIAIQDVFKVRGNMHARFDALSRTYQYHIITHKDPFVKEAYLFRKALDLDSMNLACDFLLGRKDFTSFSKVGTETYSNNCNVSYANWEVVGDNFVFTIRSDRFLRNMVRAIVGTLLEVGLGNKNPLEIQGILCAKDRCFSGASVPAHGLFLMEVRYPDGIKI